MPVTLTDEQAARLKADLAATGCLFVTSAVESLDDDVLAKLDKGHTLEDFLEVHRLFRKLGMVLQPSRQQMPN